MSDEKPPPGAVRLARVAGVPVYLDRTWLLLALFIAWTGWQSTRGLGVGFVVGYVVSLVVGILVAVLAHEVAHALAGRALGFRVHRIVATLWGGHTAYDGTGATPGKVAGVAAAGPLANLVLAALGWVGYLALPYPTSDLAWSFFFLNGLLAVFNLLPGLPLDGGQLLETLVWKVTGQRATGLLVAGWFGRVVAIGLVLWYVVRPFAMGQRPDTVSIVLALVMAWVLWSGATAAIRRAPVERVMAAVHVGDVAERVVVLPATTPLGEARAHPDLVVVDDERGRPVLALLGEAAAGAADTAALGSVVVRIPDENVLEAAPGDQVDRIIGAMASTRVGFVVLTHEGRAWAAVTAPTLEAAAQRLTSRT